MSLGLSARHRAELGIVVGFFASIIAAVLLQIWGAVGLLPYPFFELVGRTAPFGYPVVGTGLSGLTQHLAIGIVWGLIFAFAFRHYTGTKGLAFAGIMTLVTVPFFLFGVLPATGVDPFRLPLATWVQVIVSMGLANLGFGYTLGLSGRAYGHSVTS